MRPCASDTLPRRSARSDEVELPPGGWVCSRSSDCMDQPWAAKLPGASVSPQLAGRALPPLKYMLEECPASMLSPPTASSAAVADAPPARSPADSSTDAVRASSWQDRPRLGDAASPALASAGSLLGAARRESSRCRPSLSPKAASTCGMYCRTMSWFMRSSKSKASIARLASKPTDSSTCPAGSASSLLLCWARRSPTVWPTDEGRTQTPLWQKISAGLSAPRREAPLAAPPPASV
mmetsp:Transcript_118166/g.330896  ORF Transcript_118166/g.330896 Transcript_118166/m.330896 type:complete len:237 (-) Transcript_118166:181-891(-)